MNPKVDFYFNKAEKWQPELALLRTIALECGLVEELKWGVPCYTFQNRNVALIHAFKEYCALLFVKGALLSDPSGLLVQQTENVQGARQARFTNAQQISDLKPTLQAYLYEAMEVERLGLKVEPKATGPLVFPEEFQRQLEANLALKTAFAALTPGRQRAYHLHFSAPKQAKTRESRIEKCLPQIFEGKGLHD
ncbi:YdeI/OmpD-associated family protein [Hymenobacter metallilatus]|uniref:YdhG-like domain-containing protein n=1 Tax=Hymenobacter metallilatus TaxID=2493666 RepID=A0A428JCT8_9BACT|nr:DUF1801 domain-containing protein [Hymenobacter metallilatus]RSK30086.1 hypothetical protein EI290_14605 [Hymenobacter metallilatus]